MAFPDLWGEGTALIAVAAKGGNDVEFSSAINTIDIDMGDKDFDIIALVRGGRLEKPLPEAETVITFEGYPVNLDTTSTDVIQRFFTKSASWDTTEPLSVSNTRNRENFRVVILWTEDTSVTSAAAQVPSGSEALRAIFINCRLISVKPTFTDNELKFTFKFKCAPYQKDGSSNITWESSDGSNALSAVGSYS